MPRFTQSIAIVLLIALLGLSIACSKSSDDNITKDVQAKVAADPDTKDSQVNVAAKDGKVTLTGRVTSPAAQQKVEQIARAEAGVAGVDDQTTIQPGPAEQAAAQAPPPPPPPPIVVPAGTTLTVRVGQALSSKDSQARANLSRDPCPTSECWRGDGNRRRIDGPRLSSLGQSQRQDKRTG